MRIGRLENQVNDVPSTANWEENHPKIIKKELEEIKKEFEQIRNKFSTLNENHKQLRLRRKAVEEAYVKLQEAQQLALSFAEELEKEQEKRTQVEETLWNIGTFLR